MRDIGVGPRALALTPTEWHLLEVLLRHPGKLLSQKRLLAEVWGPGYEAASGNLRVYMAQLRRKLEMDPSRPRHLLTEPCWATATSPAPKNIRRPDHSATPALASARTGATPGRWPSR